MITPARAATTGVPRGIAKSIAYRFSRLLWLVSLPP
jgi:hypothetical protein